MLASSCNINVDKVDNAESPKTAVYSADTPQELQSLTYAAHSESAHFALENRLQPRQQVCEVKNICSLAAQGATHVDVNFNILFNILC